MREKGEGKRENPRKGQIQATKNRLGNMSTTGRNYRQTKPLLAFNLRFNLRFNLGLITLGNQTLDPPDPPFIGNSLEESFMSNQDIMLLSFLFSINHILEKLFETLVFHSLRHILVILAFGFLILLLNFLLLAGFRFLVSFGSRRCNRSIDRNNGSGNLNTFQGLLARFGKVDGLGIAEEGFDGALANFKILQRGFNFGFDGFTKRFEQGHVVFSFFQTLQLFTDFFQKMFLTIFLQDRWKVPTIF